MRGNEKPTFGSPIAIQTPSFSNLTRHVDKERRAADVLVDSIRSQGATTCEGERLVVGHGFLAGICALLLAVNVFAFSAGAANAQENLTELMQQARDSFRPVTADQVSQARAELSQRMQEVERWVGASSPNGQRWLRYLRWDDLKSARANEESPNLEVLDATLGQLNRDENGLELPRFRRLAAGLRRYRDLVAVSLWENPAELYVQQLDALQRQLEAYRQEPTPANEISLGQRLKVVTDIGQAPALVQAVRREFSQPNAYVEISTGLVAAGVEPINRTEEITDNILGTRIRGTSHTTGTVGVSTIPSADRAVLEFVSEGTSRSNNVGRNGPAVIRSTANTNFTATKRVELSDPGFAAQPARANATTHSDIHSISKQGGGLGSRIVSRVGWQRARQNHGRADAIAGDHAEDRIERSFNEDVNTELRDARKRYEDEYRRPLTRRGELPEYIHFSTDKDSLSIETTQANRGQLGATSPPPPAPGGHDMTMRLHESAVNNYAAIVLGGATASEDQPGDEMEFDVELPKWIQDAWERTEREFAEEADQGEEPFKPWSMTFRERPITVEFRDGKLILATHIARLRSGDQTFTNWDITGTYTPELSSGGVVLRRDGDLVVLPADFRGSLTSRQTAERSNLEKEINERSARGRGFPTTIEFDPLEPEGALADAGPLDFNEFQSNEDWLTLAWNRQGRGE
jgi:hypothetical protein